MAALSRASASAADIRLSVPLTEGYIEVAINLLEALKGRMAEPAAGAGTSKDP